MKYKKIIFRNFASYGQRDQVIEFPEDPSFFLVEGANGSGKSTIPDVMKFASYGKVDGKTQKDLVNRMNKNAYVIQTMNLRGKEVIMERGLEPNIINLTIDGTLYDKANAKIGPADYYINDLLEIPSYVFNNAICLSIKDFKSFLTMSSKDKRSLIDKIFGFQIITDMRDILSKLQKTVKDDLEKLEGQLISSTKSYQDSLQEIDELSKKLLQNNTDQIAELNKQLEKFNQLLIIHSDKQDEFIKKEREHRDIVSNISMSRTKINTEMNRIKQDLELYDNSKCPKCKSDLDTEFHHVIKNELELEYNKLDEEYKNLAKTLSEARQVEQTLDADKRGLIEKGSKIKHSIDAIKIQVKSLSNDKIDEQMQSIQNIVDKLHADIEQSTHDKSDRDSKLSWYKVLEEALGDKGIKQLAIQTILPAFNSEISRMMGEMHLNYQIIFDEQFDAKVLHLGEEISAATLSSGEGVKVDFVILISFIRLLKLKFPSINIMFLDEIFASVDQDGIYVICRILKRIVKELGLNIFVVSHNPLPTEVFEYKIEVNKVNGFSNLKMNKLS